MIDKLDGVYQYETTYETNHYSTYRRYEVTASRDTYQTCQHTVERQ